MKILFYRYPCYAYQQFILQTELMIKHLNRKDDLYFLLYNNSYIERLVPNFNGLNYFEFPKNKYSFVEKKIFDLPEFKNIDDLQKFYIENFDVGYSVLSTLTSFKKDYYINIHENLDFIEKTSNEAISIYYSAIKCLEDVKPDLVYIYNGRFHSSRPVIRAAQKLNIKVKTYEFKHGKDGYIIQDGSYPHDIEQNKRQINFFWVKNKDHEQKISVGNEFFNQLRFNEDFNKFTQSNKENNNISFLDESKINISIFNTSFHEIAGFEDWNKKFYESQEKLIDYILSKFQDNNYHFYFRVHPNLKNLKNKQALDILNLKYDNLTIIPADSEVDSYKIIERSEKVIVFGSTIGVEACYLGKPVILAGRALYEDLNIAYVAKSHDELVSLIKRKLTALPQINAIKYGYYQIARNTKISYFKHSLKSSNAFYNLYSAGLTYKDVGSTIIDDYLYNKSFDSTRYYLETSYNLYNSILSKYKEVPPSFILLLIYMSVIYKNNSLYKNSIQISLELDVLLPNNINNLINLVECYEIIKDYDKSFYILIKLLNIIENEVNLESYYKSEILSVLYLKLARYYYVSRDVLNLKDIINKLQHINNESNAYNILLIYLLSLQELEEVELLYRTYNNFNKNIDDIIKELKQIDNLEKFEKNILFKL